MSRLNTIDPETAQGKAGQLLAQVQRKLGMVPNMVQLMANSPAALESYLAMSGALAGGSLSPGLREKIALLAAESSQCAYCLSAHTAIGKQAGLSPEEIASSRSGQSEDSRDAAALRLARSIIESKGDAPDADLAQARQAGLHDGDIAEIAAHVAMNLFTNYFNRLARTSIDFPVVEPIAA